MILSTMTVAFAATTNDAKAKVLYDLGLFKGVSTTEYVPALEDEADAQQAIVLIGRALQWEVDMTATTDFTDDATWAEPYIAYAIEAGITNGVSATEFGVDIISGQRVVAWFLRALGYDMTAAWEDTATLAAEAGISIPAGTLRDDVVGVIYEALMTTPVGGDATLIEMIVLGDEALTKIAEDAGLIDASLAIVSAKAVGVEAVEVKLNKSVSADTEVVIKKGAAIYSKSIEWNDAQNTATVTVRELSDGDYTAIVGDLTADFVVDEEEEATIEILDMVIYDDQGEDEDYADVQIAVKNQYGEEMVLVEEDVTVVAYNVTQGEVIDIEDIDEDDDEYFIYIDTEDAEDEDDDLFLEGDIIRIIVTYMGMTDQANLEVLDPAASNQIVLGEIVLDDDDDERLSVDDDAADYIQLEYVLVDQYGDEIDLSDDSDSAEDIEAHDNILFVSSDEDIIVDFYTNDDGELFLELADDADDGTVVITAVVNASGSVDTKSVVVADTSKPDSVDIEAPADVVAAGDADELVLELTIEDQFGDDIDDVDDIDVEVELDGDYEGEIDYMLTVEDDEPVLKLDVSDLVVDEDDAPVEITITIVEDYDDEDEEIGEVTFDIEANAYVADIDEATFTSIFEFDGTTGASLEIDIDDFEVYDQYDREIDDVELDAELEDGDYFTVESDGTEIVITATGEGTDVITVTISNEYGEEEIDVDLEAIDTDDIDSYAMTSIGAVYAYDEDDAAGLADEEEWDVEVEIEGVNGSGDEVVLIDDVPEIVTSSDFAVASVDGNVVSGVEEGTATISVWMDGEKVDSETIEVSEVKPYAVSVEWDDIDDGILEGSDLADYVVVEDQYGVEITVDLYFAEDDDEVSIEDGIVSCDGTNSASITVITANGLTATETIKIIED